MATIKELEDVIDSVATRMAALDKVLKGNPELAEAGLAVRFQLIEAASAKMERVVFGEKLNGVTTPGLLQELASIREYIGRMRRIEYIMWGAALSGVFSGGATLFSLLKQFGIVP